MDRAIYTVNSYSIYRTMLPAYAELYCTTNFSFLRGASHPEELIERASALGYGALAITDECSLAGVVRAHLHARATGLKLIIGAAFSLREVFGDDTRLILLAATRHGYGNLSELISRARRRAHKGAYRLVADDLDGGLDDCLAILVPTTGLAIDPVIDPAVHPAVDHTVDHAADHAVGSSTDPAAGRMSGTPVALQAETGSDAGEPAGAVRRLLRQATFLHTRFPDRCWLGVPLLLRGHDAALLEATQRIAAAAGLPCVAVGDVLCHVRSRKTLQDVLTAIRCRTPLTALGHALEANAEQHLRSRLRLARLYPRALLEETLVIADRCHFSLDELRYEYPEEIVPPGHTPTSHLRALVFEGLPWRYPEGVPTAVLEQVEHELALIAELRYEPYFLTVADIVRFARDRGILCQGRGSAANSAVCYCLGITEVDPARASMLFERFISRERNEPPDIDVDFEHQRREEVVQYLYAKYGRERAALTATVVRYRSRSALRDVGRALGFDAQRIDQVVRLRSWREAQLAPEQLREAGFDPDARTVRQWLELAGTLRGFPRHLSQHTGGFVIARDRLTRLVPVENAAMAGRSVIEWDKDDLDALGLLKIDVLALGMLSAIRRALELIGQRRGTAFRLQDIPAEDAATYEMIARADTIGVFQIESRAQMSMLPRLRPRCFYDLVIEVAIVRPGPIQGGMVHPYLRRRQGIEPVSWPHDEIRPALERTLGVPIFQEQVMQVAMIAAGFSGGEADALRRAMAAWRRRGDLDRFGQRLVDGMLARGYERDFAEAIFRQIRGFGEYGFPESHAASFALLVYVSSWIKCHEPAAFLAALLDSQPMGFYAPAQLVRDARAHGIEVRGVDVLASALGSTLEEHDTAADDGSVDRRAQPAVRLGLNRIDGLSRDAAQRIVAARAARRRERNGAWFAFDSVEDLARQAALDTRALRALARADALRELAGHRAQAAWEAAAIRPLPALLADASFDELPTRLPALPEAREIVADYQALGLSMHRHPLALLRRRLARCGTRTAEAMRLLSDGRQVCAAGLVTHRQRPATAAGTTFLTLEDETGTVDVIIWPDVFERHRQAVLNAGLLVVHGRWQRDTDTGGQVCNLIARRLEDRTPWLGELAVKSRDFR